MEMSPQLDDETSAAEASETADDSGENSAQETRKTDTGQEPVEDTNGGEEGENAPESDAGEADEYDGFYHDLSDFEEQPEQNEQEDAEGGDTPTDPEGEDGDEGENEGEAESEDDGTDADGSEQEEQVETDEDASEQEEASETEPDGNSFASWEQEDRAAILAAYPDLEGIFKGKHLSQVIDDPALFGFMRGSKDNRAKYSAVEAFEKASAKLLANRAAKSQATQNSKQHIKSGGGKAATPPSSIPQSMMKQLWDMFPGKTRAELEQLYKNVT